MSVHKPQPTSLVLGLVFYVLLFSVLALFHAYANDELSNAHGCPIGLWIQHGHVVSSAFLMLSSVLFPRACTLGAESLVLDHSFPWRLRARAPPASVPFYRVSRIS